MPIHQDVVDSYLCTFTTDSPRIGAASALGHARRVAPERFMASAPRVDDDPDTPLLTSFSDYLRKVRGLEPKTREGVLLGGRRFLDWFRHHHPGQNLEALTAEHVLAAVAASAVAIGDLRYPHRSNFSHPDISSVFVLGWPPRPGSRARRPQDAPLAFGSSTAAPCMG
ncbi:MAG: hypothetical protein EOR05_29465 [Mesorhizobium sp.]|nr:MAG: hypothetical protein EOR05_29465 [Mesorhizobium sp.]